MKLLTLIEHQKKLEKAEVEIELIPGIPQIHFLGLPDKAIKESFFRIKAAMKSSGYKFPLAKQVIVNIKPNHLKKSSKGLELAVALGILIQTGQKEVADEVKNSIIYGELDLDGQVNEPVDLKKFSLQNKNILILTGQSKTQAHGQWQIHKLNDDVFQIVDPTTKIEFTRPTLGLSAFYSEAEAQLIFLMAVTGFHSLIAGAAGFGKSTLAKYYSSFLKEPDLDMESSLEENWYKVIAPHYSVTPAAFLGGGSQLFEGEIEKANNSILILDELLEFNSQILEALRGPMTGDKLRLSRGGAVREFDCQFQVIATTNLCPCGKWIPKTDLINCRFSKKRCSGYLDKLSGPILDRFGLIMFYDNNKPQRNISGYKILDRINQFYQLAVKTPKPLMQNHFIEKLYSSITLRRLNSLIAVAEIIAIERQSNRIELTDLHQAEKWALTGFLQLEQGMT